MENVKHYIKWRQGDGANLGHVRGVFETAEDGGKDLNKVQRRLVHRKLDVPDAEPDAALGVDIVYHLTAQ